MNETNTKKVRNFWLSKEVITRLNKIKTGGQTWEEVIRELLGMEQEV